MNAIAVVDPQQTFQLFAPNGGEHPHVPVYTPKGAFSFDTWYAKNRDSVLAKRKAEYSAKRDAFKQKSRDYYHANKETILARERLKRRSEKYKARRREHYHKNIHRFRAKTREHHRKKYLELKRAVLERLGGKCNQCGESRVPVLQIDHVHGNGCAERRAVSSAFRFLRKVLTDETGSYQLLCCNCNWMKRHENNECHHPIR